MNTLVKHFLVLALLLVLPACGLMEKLKGGEDDETNRTPRKEYVPVQPVPFEKLVALLPPPGDGWTSAPFEGNYPVYSTHRTSRAVGKYEKQEKEPSDATQEPEGRDTGGRPEGSGGAPEGSGGAPEGSSGEPEGSGGAPEGSGEPQGDDQPRSGPATVSLEIIDGAHVSDVYAPLAVLAHSGGKTDVHKRSVSVDGHSGIEEWNPKTGQVTLVIMVSKRFLVLLKGSQIKPDTVQRFIGGVDMKKLAQLGDSSDSP